MAIGFAFGSMVLMLAVGAGVEYASMSGHKMALQYSADAAALAAAKEIPLANSNPDVINAVASAFVASNLPDYEGMVIQTHMDPDAGSLRVQLNWDYQHIFTDLFSGGVTPLDASATAHVVGSGAVCVVALEKTKKEAIHLKKNASLDASGCGVFANSMNKQSLRVDDNAILKTAMTCSAGGFKGKKQSSFLPEPITDCPQLSDPLADRAPPDIGACDYNNLEIRDEVRTLSPGTYCGGLSVKGTSEVQLLPGIYVIKDEGLHVTDQSRFEGEYVGFYLTGNKTYLSFKKDTVIDLTAPKDGVMAGLLIFEDRDAKDAEKHEITSNNARTLLGTIYMPKGTLRIDSEAPVSDKSAYTAIIARAIELDEGPTLYLNSNYSATDVPLPSGLLGGMAYISD